MPKNAPGPHINGKQFKQHQRLWRKQSKQQRQTGIESHHELSKLASIARPLTVAPPEAGKDPIFQAALALTLVSIKLLAPKHPGKVSAHYTRRIQNP